MLRQRPAPSRTVGAVARLGACLCASLGLLAVLAACDPGPVEIDSPGLRGVDAKACAELVDALPDAVSDQPRRPVEPEHAYGAAWGDPPIELRCGVAMPAGFDKFATCQVANDVGWFVPESQIEDQNADVVMTTIGREQNIEVRVPARYRPPAAAMVDLARAIKNTIPEVKPCV